MIKRLILAGMLLVIVGGGLVLFNLFRDRMIETVFANLPEQVMPVTTVTVAATDWTPELAAIGTVHAAQGIELTVEGAGIVRSVDFAANDRVEAGQVLLTLDSETEQADLEAARTQARLAQTNLQRARQLAARGVTADANLDTAAASAEAAQAQVARAGAILETRRVVAPFAGVVGLPLVDPGAYISPGMVIATLQDLDRMRVDFSLPEQDLADVAIGQVLHVAPDGDGTSRRIPGVITGIDPRIDAASRMLKLRGRLDGPPGALRPGQFVRVAVALPHEDGVIALPQTTVMSSLYGDFVYIVRERPPAPPPPARDPAGMDVLDRLVAMVMPAGGAGNGGDAAGDTPAAADMVLEVVQVFVQTGRRADGLVEILGAAVQPGDRVVSAGQNRLSNGQQVVIDNTVTPAMAGDRADTAADPDRPADTAGGAVDAAMDDDIGAAAPGDGADPAGQGAPAPGDADRAEGAPRPARPSPGARVGSSPGPGVGSSPEAGVGLSPEAGGGSSPETGGPPSPEAGAGSTSGPGTADAAAAP